MVCQWLEGHGCVPLILYKSIIKGIFFKKIKKWDNFKNNITTFCKPVHRKDIVLQKNLQIY
jgi:hypothetical protein